MAKYEITKWIDGGMGQPIHNTESFEAESDEAALEHVKKLEEQERGTQLSWNYKRKTLRKVIPWPEEDEN